MSYSLLRIGVVAGIALGVVFACAPSAESKTAIGSVSAIVGKAMLKRQPSTSWLKAKIKLPVYESDAVSTSEESRCEIALAGDKVIRLGEKTVAVISAQDEAHSKVKTTRGAVWINVKHLVNSRSFEVSSPTAVAAIRGTVFSVNCDTNATQYMVFRGAVAITPQKKSGGKGDSTFMIPAGQQITLVKNLDQYMKAEEKAFKEFITKDQEDFEAFQKKEQDDFEKYQKETQAQIDQMVSDERKAFKTMGTLNYAVQTIDTARTAKNDWVQWNTARDKKLGW
jgi:hypothetical protein